MSRRPVSGRLSGRVEHEVALPQFGPGVHLRLANDSSAEPAGGTRRPYLTPARLEDLRQTLSARDLAVLRTLLTVRVATGEQLGRIHCRSFAPAAADRQCRRLLASLAERQLVTRLGRTIGGVRAGSAGWVYALDLAGQRLIADGDRRPRRPWTPGLPFLAHSLAIAELYVRLIERERSGEVELLSFATEPDCWRSFEAHEGRLVLKPDAAIVTGAGEFEDHWFVEVDRGTESPATLDRKLDVYRRYWQSGTEQRSSGSFPRVLWLVPDEARHAVMVDACGRQPTTAWPLFQVALFDSAVEALAATA